VDEVAHLLLLGLSAERQHSDQWDVISESLRALERQGCGEVDGSQFIHALQIKSDGDHHVITAALELLGGRLGARVSLPDIRLKLKMRSERHGTPVATAGGGTFDWRLPDPHMPEAAPEPLAQLSQSVRGFVANYDSAEKVLRRIGEDHAMLKSFLLQIDARGSSPITRQVLQYTIDQLLPLRLTVQTLDELMLLLSEDTQGVVNVDRLTDVLSDVIQRIGKETLLSSDDSVLSFFVVYSPKSTRSNPRHTKQSAVEAATLYYFVRDNTVEIVSMAKEDVTMRYEPLVTRHQALTPERSTLKTSGVRRDEVLLRKVYGPRCWNWTDLYVGHSLVIAGTEYSLIDCDKCTRDWYLRAPRFISMAERDTTDELERLLAGMPWHGAPSWHAELESRRTLLQSPSLAQLESPGHQHTKTARQKISEEKIAPHQPLPDDPSNQVSDSVETWERLQAELSSLEAELAATCEPEMLWSTF
jgi:hypothetical protein